MYSNHETRALISKDQMKKNSIEFQGYLYYLRREHFKGKRKLGFSDVESNFSLYLDIFKLSDGGESREPNGKTVLRATCTIPVPINSAFTNYYIDTVENEYLKSPVIIIESGKNPLILKIFLVHVPLSQITLFKECTLSNTLVSRGFHFLSGPSFMWLSPENRVRFQACFGNSARFEEFSDNVLDIYFVKCFCNQASEHNTYFSILKTSNTVVFYTLCLDKAGNISKPVKLPSGYFVPNKYVCLITAAFVKVKTSCENQAICDSKGCFENSRVFINNNTCICTNEKEFIVFVQGKVRYSCSVPLLNITGISQLLQFQPYQVSFLLKSESGFALVQKDNSDYLIKVTKVWDDTKQVYFGDFLHNGRPVLLLLHDTSFAREITNFTITEIGHKTHTLKRTDESSSKIVDTMVKALNKRVSLGQASLNHTEESLQDKRRVLDSAIRTLENFSSSGYLEATSHDVSLVDLALGFQIAPAAENENVPCVPDPHSKIQCFMKCISQWQTTYRDYWILGWTLKNESQRVIHSPCAVLVACDQCIETRQRVFLHPNVKYLSEPTLDESSGIECPLQPGQMISLLLALTLPVCSKASQDVPVVLSWRVRGDDNAYFTQQMALKVVLKMSDMSSQWEENFKSLSVVQQLMVFRVLQTETELEIKCQSTSLETLEETLLERGLQTPALLQSPERPGQPSTFVFNLTESPLCGINFTWFAEDRRKAQIRVFCRKPSHLLLFVHWLYENLNQDISVLAPSELNLSHLCNQMWESMGQELKKAVSGFLRLSKTTKKPATSLSRASHEQKDVQPISWPFPDYKKFRNELAVSEKNTDNILRCLYCK